MDKYYAGTRNTKFTALGLLACALLLTFLAAPFAFASNAAPGPTPPTGIEVFNRQEDLGLRVTLTWNTRAECFAYQVYRATDVNGPYTLIGGVSGSTMDEFPFFLDDTIKPGQTYYYRVTALDTQWHEGAQSVSITAKPPAYRRIMGVGKSIVVSIADQRVYFLENDVVVNVLRCSTGAGGTPTGSYQIMNHAGTVSGCAYWMNWRPNYGMHAWPSYLGEYEENLGVTPRSHGCVRLHPLEAQWAYNWTPDGTPFTVTGASCGRLPIQGMSIINGATAPSKTWYFAEGYTGGQFQEYLSMFNPGGSQVDAKTTYYPEGSAPVTETYAIPAHSRSTICVNIVSGLPQVGHSTKIEATGEIVAQRSEYFDYAGRRGGDCTLGASELSKTWFFAEGYTANGFATYLLLFNPNDATIGLDATYTPQGGVSTPVHYFMPPHSRGTILVNAVPGCNGNSVAFRVDSELPIVAERATYFTMGLPVNGVNGGDCVMGAPAASKTWYLAEGATGGYFDEYMLVSNPTPTMATVHCVFYPDTGPYGYSFQVPPGARGTISVDSIPGLANANTPVKVVSDTDIVIEQSMYCTRDSRRGGDAALGITSPSKDWYFSEGYTGGSFDEYLLLFNPSDEPLQANLVFHPEGGNEVGWAVGLPARTRITLHVDDVPGVNWVGSAVELHSEKPFVVQMSEYYCKPR